MTFCARYLPVRHPCIKPHTRSTADGRSISRYLRAPKRTIPAAPLSSGLKCVPSQFFFLLRRISSMLSVCKQGRAAAPAVYYDNSETTLPGVSLQPHIITKQLCAVIQQTPGIRSALSLFVLRILTDNPDASFSLNDFAFFANRFH